MTGRAHWGPQTPTGKPTTVKKHPKPHGIPPKNSTRGTLHFYGEEFSAPWNNFQFSALAGDTSPTTVGGFAKWQIIDRPLRRGVTVFQGYDPISVQLSVRFQLQDTYGWMTDPDAKDGSEAQNPVGAFLEDDCHILEWMAGGSTQAGPPPRVWVSSYDESGQTIPLIPMWHQAQSGSSFTLNDPFFISSLTWDQNPIRNKWGYRIRQDATVTVQFYTSTGLHGGATSASLVRSATSVVSSPGKDTPLLIARSVATAFPYSVAQQIIHAHQNKGLHLRSVTSPIKHGKRVFVPQEVE